MKHLHKKINGIPYGKNKRRGKRDAPQHMNKKNNSANQKAPQSKERLYTENAYQLYKILIEPIKTKIANKNLIIIPDGILGYIPFETLITEKAGNNNKDYKQLSYLIKDYQIMYDYSSTLLYENMISGKSKRNSHYIGFAPVTFK